MKIGQVVDLLEVEFPALSISKVRYLESEGPINPHRVDNGYCYYSQAGLERPCYTLAAQRDEYLLLHVIRERLARLDTGVEAPAPQPVARVVTRDSRIVDDGPMDLKAFLAHSGASESQIEELVTVGLISPDVRGHYNQQNLRTVCLTMEITRKGVPLRDLCTIRVPVEREANIADQVVIPRRSRLYSTGEETAWELTKLVADPHAVLLRRTVDVPG